MTEQTLDDYHRPIDAINQICCIDPNKKCASTLCMGWRWGPSRRGKILHTLPYYDKEGQRLEHPRSRAGVSKELKALQWTLAASKETGKYDLYVSYEQIAQGYCGRAGDPNPVIEVNT